MPRGIVLAAGALASRRVFCKEVLMRVAFTLLILGMSVFYTYWAFADLSFLSSTGRLGPGFFPRIIGVGLILACLMELTLGSARAGTPPEQSQYVRTVAFLIGASFLFVLSLKVIGGYAAMAAYMFGTLAVLNRKRWIQNAAISVLSPLVVYVIFELWLGAAIPRAAFLDRWLT